MKISIETFKDPEYPDSSFAKVIHSDGEVVCTADGVNELEAVKEVCLVYADILSTHYSL